MNQSWTSMVMVKSYDDSEVRTSYWKSQPGLGSSTANGAPAGRT